ncbi:hypothetical protein FC83_GL003306 [Agrilactobacillus composti DSM 18527 = JCM 14202]|uniref:Uncharacterized protein n=1 Tax=Agrilactobacillus composti DSM 18527 = JCM 14202 TaxID=1423734 RepID=X0PET8_9LACO|nr:hypothetical protein [Agrilactobacillus composti]KRM33222.1 hypothetical protein FC83_GL003306 [Agrilactobacillus composti DSM 18527 = JCM 14202]GAF40294.1 hypothetical protein JCM14202_2188 [Agrilactobacillus composti DSM 18527 = JCM 14202]
MIALSIALGLLVVILVGAGRLRYLENQVIDGQLESHVTQTVEKVRGARRFYLRTLYRSHQPLAFLRFLTIILLVLAALALAWAISIQFALITGLADTLSSIPGLYVSSDDERNLALWIMAITALIALGLRWQTVNALQRIQDAEDTKEMRDIFTTPSQLRQKMDVTRKAQLVVAALLALWLALAGQLQLLPAVGTPFVDLWTAKSTENRRNAARDSAYNNPMAYEPSNSASSSTASSSNDNGPAKHDPDTPIGALQAAKKAPASMAAQMTDADQATMIFMAYWAMEGQDPAQLFSRGLGGAHYYYHILPNNGNPLYVFNSITDAGNIVDNMFYASIAAGQVTFYSLDNSTSASQRLSDITPLTIRNGQIYPASESLDNYSFDLRQLITLYYQQAGYAKVQSYLELGTTMTAF